jgi:hypothetical protein
MLITMLPPLVRLFYGAKVSSHILFRISLKYSDRPGTLTVKMLYLVFLVVECGIVRSFDMFCCWGWVSTCGYSPILPHPSNNTIDHEGAKYGMLTAGGIV